MKKEPTEILRTINRLIREIAILNKEHNQEFAHQAEKYECKILEIKAKYETKIAELEKILIEWREQSKVYEQEVIDLKKMIKK